MSSHSVLLYYRFTKVEAPEEFAESHRTFCESLGLKGRILIAEEGINGTVSGTRQSCHAYMSALHADPRFAGIEFKSEPVDSHVFKRLTVKARPEVISLGGELNGRVEDQTAPRLSPSEWRDMMSREEVVLLDGRNGYESELGRFEGAICPKIQNFRELPGWIESHRNELEGKTILTYCTGGIRCEKLTAWMMERGFKNVFQLDGGIVKYGQDQETRGEGFLGVNVVFDERVVTSAGERAVIDTACRECGQPSANYVNCANVVCNLRMIQCPKCEASTARCCSDACRQAPRLREKGRKWYESATKKVQTSPR